MKESRKAQLLTIVNFDFRGTDIYSGHAARLLQHPTAGTDNLAPRFDCLISGLPLSQKHTFIFAAKAYLPLFDTVKEISDGVPLIKLGQSEIDGIRGRSERAAIRLLCLTDYSARTLLHAPAVFQRTPRLAERFRCNVEPLKPL